MTSSPKSEASGITSALKQVYYIHKGIVADLTAKNQILTEECRKLKQQLKDSVNSPSKCQSCVQVEQQNRSLQNQIRDLQAHQRKASNIAQSGASQAAENHSTSRKGQSSKRGNSPATGEFNANTPDGKRRKKSLASNKPQRTLHSLEAPAQQGVRESPNATVLVPETEVTDAEQHRWKKESKSVTSHKVLSNKSIKGSDDHDEAPSPRILMVPETINIDAFPQESISVDTDSDDDDEEEDNEDHNDNIKDERDHLKEQQGDKSISFNEEDDVDSLLLGAHNLGKDNYLQTQERQTNGIADTESENQESPCTQIENVDVEQRNEGVISMEKSASLQKPLTFNHNTLKDRAEKSKETQLRQSTLSQAFTMKDSTKMSTSDRTVDVEEQQIAEAIKRSLHDISNNHLPAGHAKAATDKKPSFKVPTSPSSLQLAKLKPNSKESSVRKTVEDTDIPAFNLDHSGNRSISEKAKGSRQDVQFLSRQPEKPKAPRARAPGASLPSSTFDPNGSVDPEVHFSEYLESEHQPRDTSSIHPLPPLDASLASLDETIAPNLLLERQQRDTLSCPGHRVRVRVDQIHQDKGLEDSYRHEFKISSSSLVSFLKQKSVSPDSTEKTSVGVHGDTSTKSPGNQRRLKLKKSQTHEDGRRSRVKPTSGETARENASCFGVDGKSRTSSKNSVGNGSLGKGYDSGEASANLDAAACSDDSDGAVFSDQGLDDETIAPSPQQILTGSEPLQNIPCSSRSYKFFNKTRVGFGVLQSSNLSRQPSSTSDHQKGMSVLNPCTIADDGDYDPVPHDGSREPDTVHNTERQEQYFMDEENNTLVEDQERYAEDMEESLPSLQGNEIEDSFDRVPKFAKADVAHVAVVRKRSERDKLEGFSCKQCHEYYKNSGLSEEELKKKMKVCSRHKERYRPPNTPEHFWTLGFPDTAEMIDRQKPSDQHRESPVAAEKRPRRRRQLEMKF